MNFDIYTEDTNKEIINTNGEDFEEDNEARDEIKNYFSPNQYSNYVGADKLPFIDTRNKLRNRGAK